MKISSVIPQGGTFRERSFWLQLVRVVPCRRNFFARLTISPTKMEISHKKNLVAFTSVAVLFLWAIFFLTLLLNGCASKASNPLQEPERFAEIYTKVLIANEVEADSGPPQANDARARSARADSVLRALGVDRQQFEAAVKYFGEHPERWQEVYTHVVKILEAQTKADSAAEFAQAKR